MEPMQRRGSGAAPGGGAAAAGAQPDDAEADLEALDRKQQAVRAACRDAIDIATPCQARASISKHVSMDSQRAFMQRQCRALQAAAAAKAAAERARLEEAALPLMLEAMWAANMCDIELTVRHVCQRVGTAVSC